MIGSADQLGLVKAAGCLGQSINHHLSHRNHQHCRLKELRRPRQGVSRSRCWSSDRTHVVEPCHLERVEDDVGAHAISSAPSNNLSRQHVDDETHIDHARPRQLIAPVGHPQRFGSLSGEAMIHKTRWPHSGRHARRTDHPIRSTASTRRAPLHRCCRGRHARRHRRTARASDAFPHLGSMSRDV